MAKRWFPWHRKSDAKAAGQTENKALNEEGPEAVNAPAGDEARGEPGLHRISSPDDRAVSSHEPPSNIPSQDSSSASGSPETGQPQLSGGAPGGNVPPPQLNKGAVSINVVQQGRGECDEETPDDPPPPPPPPPPNGSTFRQLAWAFTIGFTFGVGFTIVFRIVFPDLFCFLLGLDCDPCEPLPRTGYYRAVFEDEYGEELDCPRYIRIDIPRSPPCYEIVFDEEGLPDFQEADCDGSEGNGLYRCPDIRGEWLTRWLLKTNRRAIPDQRCLAETHQFNAFEYFIHGVIEQHSRRGDPEYAYYSYSMAVAHGYHCALPHRRSVNIINLGQVHRWVEDAHNMYGGQGQFELGLYNTGRYAFEIAPTITGFELPFKEKVNDFIGQEQGELQEAYKRMYIAEQCGVPYAREWREALGARPETGINPASLHPAAEALWTELADRYAGGNRRQYCALNRDRNRSRFCTLPNGGGEEDPDDDIEPDGPICNGECDQDYLRRGDAGSSDPVAEDADDDRDDGDSESDSELDDDDSDDDSDIAPGAPIPDRGEAFEANVHGEEANPEDGLSGTQLVTKGDVTKVSMRGSARPRGPLNRRECPFLSSCTPRERHIYYQNLARHWLLRGDAELALGRVESARRGYRKSLAAGQKRGGSGAPASPVAARRLQYLAITCEKFPTKNLARIARDYDKPPREEREGSLIDVIHRQRALKALGFYDGELDNQYGAKTSKAVREFQSEIGADPTGDLLPVETALLICIAAQIPRDVKSQTVLGVMFAAGLGVEQKTDEALEWLKEAHRRGDGSASYNLAILYGTGTIVSSYRLCDIVQDTKRADRYLKDAAARGHPRAKRFWRLYGNMDSKTRWVNITAALQLPPQIYPPDNVCQ